MPETVRGVFTRGTWVSQTKGGVLTHDFSITARGVLQAWHVIQLDSWQAMFGLTRDGRSQKIHICSAQPDAGSVS